MKRYGYLIEKVIDRDNLEESFKVVMRGKKRTRTTLYLYRNKERLLSEIAAEVQSGAYKPTGYREFEVVENGKVREIQSLPFKDRIALHAIMNVVSEIFTPKLIRDTYASLPGRGIHDGLNRIQTALKDRSNTEYCLKLDLKKFYHSVDQDKLIEMLGNKIKDKRMMTILIAIIRSYDKGLPIGYHSSQLLGNFYLFALDYYV
ncbi:MAG: reverse transcriptase domain-containing protein, partial [Rikenellaceae bacterium]